MPASRVRTLSCRGRTPIGRAASIRGATPEASMTASNALAGIMAARCRPEQPYRVGFGGGLQPGDQVAEPLGAADPGRCHERGQAEQPGDLGQPGRAQPGGVQPGQPAPAVQRAGQRVRQVPAARIGAAADQGGPRRTGPPPAAGRDTGRAPARPAGGCRRGRRPRHRRTGTPRRCRARRAGRRGSARRRRPGRPARPRASAAPRSAGRPPARGSRRSPPGCTAPWPAPGAAADRPDTAAAPPGGR